MVISKRFPEILVIITSVLEGIALGIFFDDFKRKRYDIEYFLMLSLIVLYFCQEIQAADTGNPFDRQSCLFKYFYIVSLLFILIGVIWDLYVTICISKIQYK